MKSKKTLRDLIYVSGNLNVKCFYSHGIEFFELMASVIDRPKNLILLKHNFNDADWNRHTRFDIVTKNEVDQLINDDVYSYGDFCWVDYLSENDLNNMKNEQISELLFFGHLSKPLNTLPMNRFGYYAHDDGWFNKLYVSQISDYKKILSNVIINKINVFLNANFEIDAVNFSNELIHLTCNGLFIDFKKLIKIGTEVRLPLTEVGHFTDMDEVYELRDKIHNYRTWLSISKKKCELIFE